MSSQKVGQCNFGSEQGMSDLEHKSFINQQAINQ